MSQILWTSSSVTLRDTVISGYIVNIEPLKIGAGREPPLEAPVDVAVLRMNYKNTTIPYIPGSSLKGVFRSYATIFAKAKGSRVCSGLSKETCGEIIKLRDEFGKELLLNDLIDLYIKENMSRKAMEIFFNKACLMCKIFGSTKYMSKIYFSDAYPIDEAGNVLDFKFNVRTGIAIDRVTGAVYGGALYTTEYIEPGAKFRFSITCRNLPNYALGLLALVIERINDGYIKIGGFKSRGFGAVKIEELKFKNREAESSLKMRSLEPSIDLEVDLSNVARLENGWIVAEKNDAWEIIKKLRGVWDIVAKSD